MKVSWDDYSQYLEKYKPCSKPPTSNGVDTKNHQTKKNTKKKSLRSPGDFKISPNKKGVQPTHQSACIVHSKFLDSWGPGQHPLVTKRYPVDSLHEGCSMMFTNTHVKGSGLSSAIHDSCVFKLSGANILHSVLEWA
jgi:hypothetical protein